jgi:large subunit ribosomal protein L11|tara:strand:+ start:28 stop:426 length:399 start_codon:yes stop_codon:yes gene_type:complete
VLFHPSLDSDREPYPHFFSPRPACASSRSQDKSFTFVLKTPPASVLLKKAAGVAKGSSQLETVGSITRDQLAEIATIKMPDLNAHKLESAMRVVAGTASNMGITIEGWDMEESKQGFREEKAALFGVDPAAL